MDIPKYFNNVVLAQFKATRMPLKVYVNGQYLIIPDMYEISDPLLGSGMNPNGEILTFDYRDIDHLLVGKNIIDLATYTKAMTGDTPEEDAKKDAKEDEATEESFKLGEITKDVLKAREKALDAEEDALKDKQKALKDEPITEDGLWANIHAKRKRGEKPAPKGSKAYKAAKKAGDKINKESINEEVDRPEEKKTAILNAIAKEEKRSEFQNRILNQIKRAIVDGEPLFKLPFKTQADYRRLMKMYKIPFSSKRAEKGNLRAESINEEANDQQRLTHLRKFGIAPNNQPQNGAYIKQVSKPGKFFVDWEDVFKLGDVALEFIKSVGSISEYDIIDLNTMKRTGKQLDVKKGQLGNLRTTYGVRVNESTIKKGSYVTNKDGGVGRVDNISGDKEIADIRYNDDTEDSLPIKNLKIFENNYTFGIGDIIKNKNTSCPHHGSIGIVQKIMQLGADNPGKIVKYRVVNSGPTYKPGDVLSKTIDQLEPMGL